jgi:hypothetical protein
MRPHIIIPIRIHPRPSRRSMISPRGRMHRLRHPHRRRGPVRSVLRAVVLVAHVAIRSSRGVRVSAIHGSRAAGSERANFWISANGASGAAIAAEESAAPAAGGVVVGGGGAVALVALVAAAEPELGYGREEED